MDIRNISTTTTRPPTGRATNQPGKASANKGAEPSPSSRVSFSAASLATLASGAIGDEPVFDAGKVEQIKAAIANGEFQVDPSKVANGLLQTVRDLLGPGAG